ncbi:MAG: type II toxin-antitoxin system VapC family toxin [Rhizomicrobium sp.]
MTSPFLLDTCACIWLLEGALPAPSDQLLADAYLAGIATFVSPITALEVGTLARKGRFKSKLTPQRWFETLLRQPGMAQAQMTAELLIQSTELPDCDHKDPYDRIIAATAREYGYTVMTRDRALLDYGRQGYLAVLEC